ncbi:MAG: alpha/beta fold hydrolase [Bdellovibrionota bacterium]
MRGLRENPRRAAAALSALVFFLGALLVGCDKQFINPNLNLIRLLPYASKKPHVFFAQTTDGKSLALHRTEPNVIREGLPPIILCHEEGMNKWIWDVAGQDSLIKYFARLGFDVWALEFRGHGESTKPEWHNELPYDWNFDDYVHKDLPAAVSYVQGKTNSRYVTLMGHGIGAMAIYAYLVTENFFDEVAGAVLLAPPGFAAEYSPAMERFVSQGRDWNRLDPLPLLHLPARAEEWALFDELMLKGTPMPRLTVKRFAERGLEVISPKVLQQLTHWVEANDFLSADLNFSYRNKLSLIRVPVLVVAGTADQFAHPGAVNYGFRVITSQDKTFLLLGRDYGQLHDYSHLGLLFGTHAKEEVFPRLFEWIEERTPGFDVWGKF